MSVVTQIRANCACHTTASFFRVPLYAGIRNEHDSGRQAGALRSAFHRHPSELSIDPSRTVSTAICGSSESAPS